MGKRKRTRKGQDKRVGVGVGERERDQLRQFARLAHAPGAIAGFGVFAKCALHSAGLRPGIIEARGSGVGHS